jgi:hypothetical protein
MMPYLTCDRHLLRLFLLFCGILAFTYPESQNQNKRIDANGTRFNDSFVDRLQTLWFRGLVCMTCCPATVVEELSLDSQL